MIGNIRGIIDKVASRKLGVTAVAGGRRGHRGGGDCLADSGYCDGVYRRADGGGYVGRVKDGTE